MNADLERAMSRLLHRCAYLQVAAQAGMPLFVVQTQVESLQRLVEELLPLIKAQDAENLTAEIQMRSLSEVHEQALLDTLGVNDANTDKNDPAYPPQDWC